ncbi:MAG TPA: hypothetical protein VFZ53_13985, partial [Polyangiaceae bacterium]
MNEADPAPAPPAPPGAGAGRAPSVTRASAPVWLGIIAVMLGALGMVAGVAFVYLYAKRLPAPAPPALPAPAASVAPAVPLPEPTSEPRASA